MPKLSYKAVNFDLDTKKLREFYPRKNYLRAYEDIKRFMKVNGFSHRQWSGYRSDSAMSDSQILLLVKKTEK